MTLFKRFGWITAMLLGLPLSAGAQTTQLPISTFIDAQPVGSLEVWTDPARFRFVIFDAYGKVTSFFGLDLGTMFDGSVMLRELGDGRTRVTVVLHTAHALCWGYQFGDGWTAPQDAFGTPVELVAVGQGPAAFGESNERIVFTMPTGAPFPPMGAVWGDPANRMESDDVVINCEGVLRPGSGYPDGTPGRARTTQTVLLNTGVPAGCPPEKDANCAPAERVDFWPVGGGH